MRDFIHRIATDRYLYAALILLDWLCSLLPAYHGAALPLRAARSTPE